MSKIQTTPKKRLSIMIEMPYLKRFMRKLEDIKVPGYTVIPAIAGSGGATNWRADALSSDTGQMAQVIMLVDEGEIEGILKKILKGYKKQVGIISVSDEQIVNIDDF